MTSGIEDDPVRVGDRSGGDQKEIVLLVLLIVNGPMFVQPHRLFLEGLPGAGITDEQQSFAIDIFVDESDVRDEDENAGRFRFAWNRSLYKPRTRFGERSGSAAVSNAVAGRTFDRLGPPRGFRADVVGPALFL